VRDYLAEVRHLGGAIVWGGCCLPGQNGKRGRKYKRFTFLNRKARNMAVGFGGVEDS